MFHVEGTRVNLREFTYKPSIEADDFGDTSIYCYQTAFCRISR